MKAFFLTRQLREKLLLLGLIALAAMTWVSSVSNRGRAFWRDFSQTSALLAEQKHWLRQQERIESEVDTAVRNLDPKRTFDGVRLQAELDAIARTTGVSNTSGDDVRTERTSQFSVHSMQFTIRNVDYGSLVRFYQELSKRAPYIGIEQFRIVANRSNPAQLNASLRVSSVEIAR